MTINWAALGVVAVVSLVVAVLVVVLVSFALVGLSARESEPAERALPRAAGTASAVICLVAAATIVLYGLYLLVF